ncbi:MAG: amidohydrolase family protein, partial [Chloroflexota bacterium]
HEALRAYTWNGAYASFEEHVKGTLTPGKVGDVVVFNTDISEVEPHEVGQVEVDMTVTDGHIVYRKND